MMKFNFESIKKSIIEKFDRTPEHIRYLAQRGAFILLLVLISQQAEAQKRSSVPKDGIPVAESVKKAREARELEMRLHDGSSAGSSTSGVKKIWDDEKGRFVYQETLHGEHAKGALHRQDSDDLERPDPSPQQPPVVKEDTPESRKAAYYAKRQGYAGYPIQPTQDRVEEARGKLGNKQN